MTNLQTDSQNLGPLNFSQSLLKWYKDFRRKLPWRLIHPHTPDPYFTWVSEIMLQQTTVPTVKSYFEKFINKWPTVQDLAEAPLQDVLHLWQGLGYYSRARNLHKCSKTIVELYHGIFPKDKDQLLKLPGIGPYTAAAIRAISFNQTAVVVDGNIERIMSRLFAIETPLPKSKVEITQKAESLMCHISPGDYAQALMDLGSMVCTPKSPKCLICPVQQFCAVGKNLQKYRPDDYPRKLPKVLKPTRTTTFFWIENERGEVLLEKRPESGLLGGMMGFPSTIWFKIEQDEFKNIFEEYTKDLRKLFLSHQSINLLENKVIHTFTHFHLKGQVVKCLILQDDLLASDQYQWIKKEDFHLYPLPTLMKKVVIIMNHKPDESNSN